MGYAYRSIRSHRKAQVACLKDRTRTVNHDTSAVDLDVPIFGRKEGVLTTDGYACFPAYCSPNQATDRHALELVQSVCRLERHVCNESDVTIADLKYVNPSQMQLVISVVTCFLVWI